MKDDVKTLIIDLLENEGRYKRYSRLSVSDTDFEFDMYFEGPHENDSLVLMSDIETANVPLLARRLRSLRRSLIRSGSARSITLIVTGNIIDPKSEKELSKYGRVINVLAAESVRGAVLELLPITIPETETLSISPESTFLSRLESQDLEFFTSLKKKIGEKDVSVESAALNIFSKSLTDASAVEQSHD